MTLPLLIPRVVLAGWTGLLLLGGIAGAATVDGGSDQAAPANPSAPSGSTLPGDSTPSTTAAPTGEPLAAAPVAPGSVTTATTGALARPAPGATATTTKPARPGRSATPGPLVAPKPGDYAYEATSVSSSGTRTDRATTKVEAAGTEGPTTLQTITIPLDLGGQQAVARNTVAWSAAGAFVRRSVISFTAFGQPQQLDCVWQPAFPQYPGRLAVDDVWSFDTGCSGKIQGFDVTIQQRATRRVTAAAQVAIRSGSVATWTIADDTTLVLNSPIGVATVRTVGTQSLAPSLGLPVRTEAKVESSTAGSAPERSTLTTKLVALP